MEKWLWYYFNKDENEGFFHPDGNFRSRLRYLLFFVDGFETLNLVHVVLAEVTPFIIWI